MTFRNPFRLKKVCADCPFRADVPFYGLHPERVADIAQALRDGATFHCHKTVSYDLAEQHGEERSAATSQSQFCAGALATMEKGQEPNQIVRIAERLGLYVRDDFDWGGQPVFVGLDAWESALIARANSHSMPHGAEK